MKQCARTLQLHGPHETFNVNANANIQPRTVLRGCDVEKEEKDTMCGNLAISVLAFNLVGFAEDGIPSNGNGTFLCVCIQLTLLFRRIRLHRSTCRMDPGMSCRDI